jgi:hypothetical protein
MTWEKALRAPPLVQMPMGVVGHLLAWENNDADGPRWAWAGWA